VAKLTEYRQKRRFDRTPEPPGPEPLEQPEESVKPAVESKQTRLPKPKLPQLEGEYQASGQTENTFVVQKHAATRLHYDFRLAIDGTLKSWPVPKGPSLNPADKRLAVMTEDHPLDYANFEGQIPEGNYGAGTVMVWDRGTYAMEGPGTAVEQLRRGEIKFHLNGEKLRGSFVLVKLKNSEKGNEWLMIKHKDAAANPSWNVDEHDGSVLTGRTLDEIRAEQPPRRSPWPLHVSELHGADPAAMPVKLEPMLATLTDKPFSGPDWLFEIKWDGVRALTWIKDGQFIMRSRNGIEITQRYPEFADLPKALSARNAILDGEIVALNERGLSDFGLLQQRMHVRVPAPALVLKVPAVYFLFDLLFADGYDLREVPLLERKQLLERLLHTSDRFRFSDHQIEYGKELFDLAKQQGLEGIVAKRVDSRYVSDRSTSWAKIKVTQTLDAVIGGWTAPRSRGIPFGSILLGLYDKQTLRFIGHAGSGFDTQLYREIAPQLKALEIAKSPFDKVPETNEKAFWATPKLVARVKFGGWTQEHALRHPVFQGLREDIRSEDCRWETEAAPAPSADVVRAPAVVGNVISKRELIEAELFKGRAETLLCEIAGKRLRFPNLNKVYFPESGYTKRNLLAYYYQIADYILPFLKGRPLVLRRYPDGIKGQAFFQKDLREGLPDWFKVAPVSSEEKGQDIHYATADDLASLLFLTGLGCIDHNAWSSRYDDLEHPDYFFFDLDPSDGTEFSVNITIAKALLEKLDALKLKSFLKTSGATGIHIYVPVEARYTYEQLRTFAEIVARLVSSEHPKLVTHERIVAKRPAGRILIDVQQNAMGKPLAAPYSVRAFPKAPVSAPLLPGELKPSLLPQSFNIKSIFQRLEKHGDLWSTFWDHPQTLEAALALLANQAQPKKRTQR
jgi:bifunctional non-homologous end joining protein LigD